MPDRLHWFRQRGAAGCPESATYLSVAPRLARYVPASESQIGRAEQSASAACRRAREGRREALELPRCHLTGWSHARWLYSRRSLDILAPSIMVRALR